MATLTFPPSQLGKDLKTARKAQHVSQAELAKKCGLSVPAIRRVENGRGNLDSLQTVISALHLVLGGRNLPAADSLGKRIALLRKREKYGQRALAEMLGVSHPTVIRLEKYNCGRMDTLEGALMMLKSGARLVPEDSQPAFFAQTGNSSAFHGWETPRELLEKLYSVFGTFDLDPCSGARDRRTASVRARVYYTAKDGGLDLPWFGTTFVNPPYGRTLHQWTTKARTEVESGSARAVIACLPARTDTAWFHSDVARHASVFFLRKRLSFGDSGQAAPFPSILAVWGATPEELEAMRAALPDAWNPQVFPGC